MNEEQLKPVNEYKPELGYTWDPSTKVTLDGGAFGFLYNTIMKDKAEILSKLEVMKLFESKLKEMVESGVAVVHSPQVAPPEQM